MNIKKIIPIIGGVALIAALLFIITETSDPIPSLDFTYDSNFEIKNKLETYEISMSNPLKIHGDMINQHCNFFKDPQIQSKVEYCTSTELKDSTGNFLGNIHMVGNPTEPQLAMAVIQTSPFLSEKEQMLPVFETMIQTLVCDCWAEEKPGGFESVSEWVEATQLHHLEAKRTTSKSEITGLAQKEIVLEITTNTEGYLWKLLIDK